MQHFKLPLLKVSDSVESACEAMIDRNISGIVVRTATGYHLVHFTQIETALAQGLRTLRQVTPFAPLGSQTRTDARMLATTNIFWLHEIGAKQATVVSSHERFDQFSKPSGGFKCDGPKPHYYPPNKADGTKECVVETPKCPGKTPR